MNEQNINSNASSKKLPNANLLAFLFGIVLVLLIIFGIETYLRLHYKTPGLFYYTLNPSIVNHVEIFRRSPLPHATDSGPRIFCLGGSTTNGCNMPIPISYPNILDLILKRTQKGGSAYNFGVSGVGSVTTNFFIKQVLPRYKPNCVVIHDGYNDLPVIIKKLNNDRYEYIRPQNYYDTFNPYIKNPVFRYIASCIKYNFRATRRFLVTFVKNTLHKGGDLFLGFDYTKYSRYNGSAQDIIDENKRRLEVMLERELDSIEYCLKNGIKVIVILEPYIRPMHFVPPFDSGFRDAKVGAILSQCHKVQQTIYGAALLKKYKDNKDVVILDMRGIFKDRYDELFYDECHLNGKGNALKAQYVYVMLLKLFPELRRNT